MVPVATPLRSQLSASVDVPGHVHVPVWQVSVDPTMSFPVTAGFVAFTGGASVTPAEVPVVLMPSL